MTNSNSGLSLSITCTTNWQKERAAVFYITAAASSPRVQKPRGNATPLMSTEAQFALSGKKQSINEKSLQVHPGKYTSIKICVPKRGVHYVGTHIAHLWDNINIIYTVSASLRYIGFSEPARKR